MHGNDRGELRRDIKALPIVKNNYRILEAIKYIDLTSEDDILENAYAELYERVSGQIIDINLPKEILDDLDKEYDKDSGDRVHTINDSILMIKGYQSYTYYHALSDEVRVYITQSKVYSLRRNSLLQEWLIDDTGMGFACCAGVQIKLEKLKKTCLWAYANEYNRRREGSKENQPAKDMVPLRYVLTFANFKCAREALDVSVEFFSDIVGIIARGDITDRSITLKRLFGLGKNDVIPNTTRLECYNKGSFRYLIECFKKKEFRDAFPESNKRFFSVSVLALFKQGAYRILDYKISEESILESARTINAIEEIKDDTKQSVLYDFINYKAKRDRHKEQIKLLHGDDEVTRYIKSLGIMPANPELDRIDEYTHRIERILKAIDAFDLL